MRTVAYHQKKIALLTRGKQDGVKEAPWQERSIGTRKKSESGNADWGDAWKQRHLVVDAENSEIYIKS